MISWKSMKKNSDAIRKEEDVKASTINYEAVWLFKKL